MEKQYTISQLVRSGAISPTVKHDIDIADKLKQLLATGMTNGRAVKHIANEFGRTTQSIYKALKRNPLGF